MSKKALSDCTLPELTEALAEMGEKPYRAGQLYRWVHQKNAFSYNEMTDLSKRLRERLQEVLPHAVPQIARRQGPDAEGSMKFLLRYADGATVEAVLLRYQYGNSICISSQVGCRMGCAFCASTLQGCDRNLTAGEMLLELYAIEREIGESISHVVVMGSGEPLDNLDALIRFLHMLTDEDGHHLSMRNITVSTCGLVPEIKALAKEKMAVNLALSLHAPTDKLRQSLMPIAKKYSIEEVFDALAVYYESNHRRITIEYSLIAGINDSEGDAEKLTALLRGKNVLVNLIPINPIAEKDFLPPAPGRVQAFRAKLEKCGIHVTIRRSMGSDIQAACGQLRKHFLEEEA